MKLIKMNKQEIKERLIDFLIDTTIISVTFVVLLGLIVWIMSTI